MTNDEWKWILTRCECDECSEGKEMMGNGDLDWNRDLGDDEVDAQQLTPFNDSRRGRREGEEMG